MTRDSISWGKFILIIGVDNGACVTKGVLMKDSLIIKTYSTLTEDSVTSALKVLNALLKSKQEAGLIKAVAVSGGGSRRIGKRLLDSPVIRVDEIRAIGIGGLTLVGKSEGLIVNVGTGTAIVAAYNEGRKAIHLGGTGVGGGTLLGLAERMLGTHDFEELENLAVKGDAGKVDLTVFDIVGGPVGIVPAEATASNFGKIHAADASREDLAAGLFNMVCQVVGVVGAMAAKAFRLEENVIVTGGLAKSILASNLIRNTMNLFGINPCIPKNCEYCTAVGAARFLSIEET